MNPELELQRCTFRSMYTQARVSMAARLSSACKLLVMLQRVAGSQQADRALCIDGGSEPDPVQGAPGRDRLHTDLFDKVGFRLQ